MESIRWKKKGIGRFTGLKKGEVNLSHGKSRKDRRRGDADSPSGCPTRIRLGEEEGKGRWDTAVWVRVSVKEKAGSGCQGEKGKARVWAAAFPGPAAREGRGAGLAAAAAGLGRGEGERNQACGPESSWGVFFLFFCFVFFSKSFQNHFKNHFELFLNFNKTTQQNKNA